MDNLAVIWPRSRREKCAIGLLVLGLAMAAPAGAQCVMCGTVGQGKNDPLVKGMGASIVFMVSMPFAVVATVGGWLWKNRRGLDPANPDEKNGDLP